MALRRELENPRTVGIEPALRDKPSLGSLVVVLQLAHQIGPSIVGSSRATSAGADAELEGALLLRGHLAQRPPSFGSLRARSADQTCLSSIRADVTLWRGIELGAERRRVPDR